MYEFKSGFAKFAKAYGATVTVGGIIVNLSFGDKIFESPEKFLAILGTGVAAYFIGDKIHKKEIDNAIYDTLKSIDRKLLELPDNNNPTNTINDLTTR